MARALVVSAAFGSYARGQIITDQAEIDAIVGTESETFVVSINQPDEPAPAKKKSGAPITSTSSET